MPSIQLESKKTFLIPRAVPSRLSAKWLFFLHVFKSKRVQASTAEQIRSMFVYA